MEYTGSIHNHSDWSNIRLRDCIIKLDESISYAESLGHKVIGITEHDFTGGWIKANRIAKKHPNIKVILGNEIYLCRNGLNAQNYNREYDRYYHFILLAKDLVGAKQIMEISTRAWKRSYMARGMRRVPTYYQDLFDIIGANPGHVIGSTACLGGALPTQLLKYKATENEQLKEKIGIWIEQMDNLFGRGNFFLELQPSKNKEQIYVNERLLNISGATGIPYIITTDSHYLKKEDRIVHKAYLNAQNGDREVDDFYATTYMMGTEELESFFSYLSREQLDTAYKNIESIAQMCEEYSLEKPLRIPNLKWKEVEEVYLFSITLDDFYTQHIPMLRTFWNSEYKADKYLAQAVINGIKKHTDLQNEEAYKEINLCLEDTWVSSEVNKARWSAYYLNLQGIIDVCWEADSIVGPGRGSGVGFILLYLLDITQINPMREKTKTFRWRFLNPDRVSVLDVDFDIEGSKRAQVLNKFREVYGEDRVANVATFRTEKSKSAILTAARGLGIDVDIAQYIASLVPSDRGLIRSLDQCMYGDTENDWKPIKQFVYEMSENYPELWNVAHAVEGLICGSGVHAGGVIFVDEPFTESAALMRAPDGTICTQFELHDAEAASLIKYDALSVEAMDKIHNCIDLLCDYGYAERKATLKETYESIIGIYNIERDDPKMWEMVWNHKIQSLFQMEKQSGIQGIALLHPTSVDDLATLNSVIRLMAQERGGEMPTNKLARFKRNPKLWDEEMERWGLTEEERAILHKELDTSYGICESQEGFMQLVQSPECGGFNLTWADRLRKSIAKKNPKEFDQLTEEYYQNMKDKGLSKNLCDYVWKVLVAYSRGYGFNKSHTLAYSLIALQEMNLAYKYPIIFWNCACLINDAGGNELEDDEDNVEIKEVENIWENEIESFYEEDDDEDDDDEEEIIEKKKKKQKKINYGKIASAIGKMKTAGIQVSPPDINYSGYTFSPDPNKNLIRYGLSGITGLGDDAIKDIIINRPYSSVNELIEKVKLKKPQVINLIKAGAFDEYGDRFEIMQDYISKICDAKKRVTLQNMQMMINFNMIPQEYDFQVKVYNFNKYLKKFKMEENKYYGIDNISMYFFGNNFDIDMLFPTTETESGFMIKCDKWDAIYQKQMDIIRPWVKKNAEKLLKELNDHLMAETWNKYCKGSLSKWEMESTSCYFGEHELNDVEDDLYNFEDFTDLPSTPDIENVLLIKGKQIPIFRLSRIIGTVLDRDKNKRMVTLLTKSGVVTVKIYGDAFTHYDRQISERGADGKKHVVEKSWFHRGNKIIVTGIKQEDGFLAKKYSRTPYHLVELITNIHNDGTIETRGERVEVEAA